MKKNSNPESRPPAQNILLLGSVADYHILIRLKINIFLFMLIMLLMLIYVELC